MGEPFVVHSVVSCLVTHLMSLPHFYIMSIILMVFREKREVQILSQIAILKLNAPPTPVFGIEEFLHPYAIPVIMEGKGGET